MKQVSNYLVFSRCMFNLLFDPENEDGIFLRNVKKLYEIHEPAAYIK